jgi:putative Ca2+/H+ antiporter (TMEM165/GDT1 family)
LFAANPLVKASGVFLAAAGALILSTAIAVTAGSAMGHWLSPRVVKRLAGVGFILIGVLMLADRA